MRGGGRASRALGAGVLCMWALMTSVPAASAAGHASSGAYVFAPYVDETSYPPPDLSAIRRASGVRQISLAFITAASAGQCAPRWGGIAEFTTSGRSAYRRGNVLTFEHAGGQAVISFGGENGVELATACPNAGATAAAYAGAIATYHPARIDFDIEGAAVADRAAMARRDTAIAGLQRAAARAHRPLPVSFTLPVLPSGLTEDGLTLIRDAIRRHVTLAFINLMAMDYGDGAAPEPTGRMGSYAIEAARNVVRQLARIYPHRAAAALRHLVGLTPMIGRNDTPTETFGLADAQRLAEYARTDGIGMLAMWSLGRDRACPRPTPWALNDCSGVGEARYGFTRALAP